MAEYKLAAEPRSETGKGPARRARAAGRVPAVLYGHGMDPVHLYVDARELGFAMRTDAGGNVLLELQVGKDRHLALPREIQRHPLRGSFTHVDFLAVRRGEKVTVNVPVHLVGEAVGVRENGGIADQDLYQLNLEAEVTRVPESIEVDITALDVGDVLRVSDVSVPRGVTILDDPEASVVSVVAPAAAVAEEAAEEALAAEGEAAEGEAAGAEAGEASKAEAGEDS
jgi:large subunit ribosomal protein L25